MHSLLKIVLVTSLIFSVSAQPSEENSGNSRFMGSVEYSVFKQCNGTRLIRPEQLEPENKLFQDCFIKTSKSKDNSEDELPALEWKTYLCILNESSVFPDGGEMNFDSYFNFMTENYPKNISDEIKSRTKNCSKPDGKLVEPWEKVLSYAECFYRSEQQFCDIKFVHADDDESVKNADKVKKCEPLAGHDRVESCCKGKPIPVGFFELVSDFVLNTRRMLNGTQRLESQKCKESFLKRQDELQEGLNETSQYAPVSCGTCDYNPTPYTADGSLDLSVSTLKINGILKQIFPDKIQTEIKAGMKRYSPTMKAEVKCRGQKWKLITDEKYVDEFNGLTDELDKIYSYCEYIKHYTQSMYTSFLDYCTDSANVKKTFKGFFDKSNSTAECQKY